jgi:hypothetical protein
MAGLGGGCRVEGDAKEHRMVRPDDRSINRKLTNLPPDSVLIALFLSQLLSVRMKSLNWTDDQSIPPMKLGSFFVQKEGSTNTVFMRFEGLFWSAGWNS